LGHIILQQQPLLHSTAAAVAPLQLLQVLLTMLMQHGIDLAEVLVQPLVKAIMTLLQTQPMVQQSSCCCLPMLCVNLLSSLLVSCHFC
jgi:hypothetical protein